MAAADSSVALLASLVMCLVSLGCLIGGLVYLKLASEEQREHLTVGYYEAIHNWPKIRADFDGMPVTARAMVSSVPLVANLTADVLLDEENILPQYSALVYRASGVPVDFFPPAEIGAMEALPLASPLGKRRAQGPNIAVVIDFGGSHLKIEAFPIIRATVRHTAGNDENSHCGSRHGVDIAGECWAFSKLQRLCVQVEHNGSHWQLVPRVKERPNSYGCDYAQGDWATPTYGQMHMEGHGIHSSEQWPTGIVRFEDLVIEVRSRWDPYLVAQELTHGTLNFGMTAEEEDVLGIVLIVMSIGFSCPLCCTICRHWCKSRQKQRPRRYRPPSAPRWKPSREPDPELVGMRYAMDQADDTRVVESRRPAPATGLELAIDDAIEKRDIESSTS